MWFNKKHPSAVYIDIRKLEKEIIADGNHFEVNPDFIMDFRQLEFPDKSFKLIAFDPPHLTKLKETSVLHKKYGALNAETWQSDMKRGFEELWRVLDDYGILLFKWSNVEIPYKKVLALFHTDPLFGSIFGNKKTTKWFCFMKIPTK